MQRKRGGFLMACGLILLLCAGGWGVLALQLQYGRPSLL